MGQTRTLDGWGVYSLFKGIFGFTPQDRRFVFLVDLPHGKMEDNEDWRWLRETVAEWRWRFAKKRTGGPSRVDLLLYQATGNDGANLPGEAVLWPWSDLPSRMENIAVWPRRVRMTKVWSGYDCAVLATWFSATQPLKMTVATRGLPLRAATMPGFTRAMMPALFLDAAEVARRVNILKGLLDQTMAADLKFVVDGREFDLRLDLRLYPRHASTGRLLKPGEVGNVPSGEAFAVPNDQADSETVGWLPIQFAANEEPVLYRFEHNRVIEVVGDSRRANEERALIEEEPSCGNLAELGLGVLAGMSLRPVGNMLLDEKLGLHLAFGRNDGFGGRVWAPFHRDHVFLPETMPQVEVARLTLHMNDQTLRVVIVDNEYLPDLFG
jgi:hypothetical protein